MASKAPAERRVLCFVDVGTKADDLGLRVGEQLAQTLDLALDAEPAPRHGAVDWPAQADQADIVVTPAEPKALAALWQPARSPALAARLGVPTVVIPEGAVTSADPNWSEEVVCGVDHSRGACSAARVASALAERLEVPLSLVHAQEPVPVVALGPAGGAAAGVAGAVLDEESRDAAWELLSAVDEITPKRARLRLRRGRPARCLDEYAAEREAPLIVVGAPAHGRLSSFVLGSTAWELCKRASTPVMYVPEDSAWTS